MRLENVAGKGVAATSSTQGLTNTVLVSVLAAQHPGRTAASHSNRCARTVQCGVSVATRLLTRRTPPGRH